MSTRISYEQKLQDLSDLVVTMASMVDKAIARSIDALRVQNVALAKDVRRGDSDINKLHRQGEEMAVLLIATQAPMAGDVRRITAAMSMFSNLERMGDYAAGVAKIVIETADEEPIKPLVDLPRMAHVAREMLDDSITAYINKDADVARQVAIRDDELDDLYDRILQDLVTIMMNDPAKVKRATRLLWAAHNFERIGDRVTNICERVVYSATGEIEELDGGRKERQRFSRNGSSDNGASG